MPDNIVHILHIAPTCCSPDLPNFSWRYQKLPERFHGHVISRAPSEYHGRRYGNFSLHAVLEPESYGIYASIKHVASIIAKGFLLHRKRPFDLIVCYDPLTLGISGAILKVLTGAKLVVEVNGHLLSAGFLQKLSMFARLKRVLFSAVIKTTLSFSDGIKYLNCELKNEFLAQNKRKKLFCFPDYVPTSLFRPSQEDDKFIFFAGHPFFLKGVDILISAFRRLCSDFPDYSLVIMGHNKVDLDKYQRMAEGCAQIQFNLPVFYDEMPAFFSKCSFFVLPSRTEAMGRVLIEAMSSGKAVVGSRVGGIPEVVQSGVTGYLFEKEDAEDLEAKMRILLENVSLRRDMGAAGRQRVETHYCEEIFIGHLTAMIDEVLQL